MSEIFNSSEILDNVKNWVLENLIDKETLAVFLIGSWAKQTARETSDVDIVVIKNNLSPFLQNKKIDFEGKTLDIWFHDQEYSLNTVNKQIENLSDIYQISLYLSLIEEYILWFEKDQFVQENLTHCKDWKWNPEYRIYIKMMGKPPKTDWGKKAYEENLNLLSRFEYRFDNGLPVTHRLKDYPELYSDVDKEKTMELYKIMMSLYKHIRTEREWTEVTDARKAIQEENWQLAFVLLKDVLYFLLKRYISPPSMELRDPSFWTFAEERILPQEYIRALELAYPK